MSDSAIVPVIWIWLLVAAAVFAAVVLGLWRRSVRRRKFQEDIAAGRLATVSRLRRRNRGQDRDRDDRRLRR